MTKQEVLQKYFGYDGFRPGQESLIDGILEGKDVFGIMPTGGGKSICYQVPALMLPGITLVVSPLISLMWDQVMALKAAGVPAAFINSSLNAAQVRKVYQNLLAGMYKIVYVAPERLGYEGFQSVAARLNISFLAVDEAHCISQWGQDFRPSYLHILDFVGVLPKRPVIGAFTATATAEVREDVERILELQDPVRAVTGFDRPNLFFEVRHPAGKDTELRRILNENRNKSGIVYCSTRKNVEKVCGQLQEQGFAATRYHAGLEEEERKANQEDFLYDRATVMVATNAFGMGIDKSNVSFVIHYNMPKSIESYYQEAGRAGRDGTGAKCILLFSANDVHVARFLINNSEENEDLDSGQRELVRQQDLKRLEAMVGYCETRDCLRGYLLEYFGQAHPEICGTCGNCQGDFVVKNVTGEAKLILGCIRDAREKLGYSVGAAIIGRVLQGSREKRIVDMELYRLSQYGAMKTTGRTEIRAMIAQLELEGFLRTDPEFQTLEVLPEGELILKGQGWVSMKVRRSRTEEKSPASADGIENTALYEALRQTRAGIARENNVPAYTVFSNATLADMARKKPRTTTEFKRVSGVGELKASWYAKDFLRVIREFEGL